MSSRVPSINTKTACFFLQVHSTLEKNSLAETNWPLSDGNSENLLTELSLTQRKIKRSCFIGDKINVSVKSCVTYI